VEYIIPVDSTGKYLKIPFLTPFTTFQFFIKIITIWTRYNHSYILVVKHQTCGFNRKISQKSLFEGVFGFEGGRKEGRNPIWGRTNILVPHPLQKTDSGVGFNHNKTDTHSLQPPATYPDLNG
jgi:hypothetical protein